MNCPISIIIPVYKVERYIERCVHSLFDQTLEGVEYIFVDDCSPDGSMDILHRLVREYAYRNLVVKIVAHETNRGVAAARNTGLEYAMGDYIYYVDADDWIESDTLASLVHEAQRSGADIVGCAWFLTFEQNERYMKQSVFATPMEALEKMMCGVMRWNLWLFLVRRSLYQENGIRFIEGMNMGEDLLAMVKLFACAGTVTSLNRPLYHYVQTNAAALTHGCSSEHITQVTANVLEAEKYLKNHRPERQWESFICFLKLNIKLPLLITGDESRYRQWTQWFPEANGYAMKNKWLPLRTRLLQWAAVRRQFWLVRLYYYLVIKVIYGIIYK